MVDRNGDGINDFAPGQKVKNPQFSFLGKNAPKQTRAKEVDDQGGMTLSGFLTRPVRQGLNFLGDLTSGFSRNKHDSYGTGAGDQIFGVTKGYYDEKNADPGPNSSLLNSAFPTNKTPAGGASRIPFSPSGGVDQSGPAPLSEEWRANLFGSHRSPAQAMSEEDSFASTLAEALAMLQSQGLGGGVSYDPYRDSARSQYNEADSKTAAIYRALSDSIANDAAGVGASYDDTLNRQQTVSDQGAQALTAGAQSGTDMITQQAKALGIEQGVQNQIQQGNTVSNDLQRDLSDNAAANTTAKTALTANRQSALDYNTSVKQASDQEGALQRAKRSAELNSILAQLDVGEAEANRSSQSNLQGQAMSLAQYLQGQKTDESRYQDSLSQQAAKLASDQYVAQLENQPKARPAANSESNAFLMKLLGFQDPKQFQTWMQENPAGYKTYLNLVPQ